MLNRMIRDEEMADTGPSRGLSLHLPDPVLDSSQLDGGLYQPASATSELSAMRKLTSRQFESRFRAVGNDRCEITRVKFRAGLLSHRKIWWPGTELNRRRQPFQAKINSDCNDFVARVALEVVDSAWWKQQLRVKSAGSGKTAFSLNDRTSRPLFAFG